MGWLMQRRPRNDSQSANSTATCRTRKWRRPPSVRAGNGLHRCANFTIRAEQQSCGVVWLRTLDSFDHSSNIHAQFTSNHEDYIYMHPGRFEMSWRGWLEVKYSFMRHQQLERKEGEPNKNRFQQEDQEYLLHLLLLRNVAKLAGTQS